MIRFIDLGTQIGASEDSPREFCYYNTVTDRFLEFNGEQVFEKFSRIEYYAKLRIHEKLVIDSELFQRLRNVTPEEIVNPSL